MSWRDWLLMPVILLQALLGVAVDWYLLWRVRRELKRRRPRP